MALEQLAMQIMQIPRSYPHSTSLTHMDLLVTIPLHHLPVLIELARYMIPYYRLARVY